MLIYIDISEKTVTRTCHNLFPKLRPINLLHARKLFMMPCRACANMNDHVNGYMDSQPYMLLLHTIIITNFCLAV